jgi:hypothetical protein
MPVGHFYNSPRAASRPSCELSMTTTVCILPSQDRFCSTATAACGINPDGFRSQASFTRRPPIPLSLFENRISQDTIRLCVEIIDQLVQARRYLLFRLPQLPAPSIFHFFAFSLLTFTTTPLIPRTPAQFKFENVLQEAAWCSRFPEERGGVGCWSCFLDDVSVLLAVIEPG